MTTKKRNPVSLKRRRIARLEQQRNAVEAQVARLEQDASLNLAVRDHFVLWRRTSLFAPVTSDIPH